MISLTPPQHAGGRVPHYHQVGGQVQALHVPSTDTMVSSLLPGGWNFQPLAFTDTGRGVIVLHYNLVKWESSLVVRGVGAEFFLWYLFGIE